MMTVCDERKANTREGGMSAAGTIADPAERAFADFVARYWPEALRFFRQGLYREQDRQQAEDCAQETFLKLARRYRDDTATVRAIGKHQQLHGRPMTVAALAVALGATPTVAESRARRCVESGWLHVAETATGPCFGCAVPTGPAPLVLDLAPLAAMRWTTYRNILADHGRRAQTRLNPLTDDLDALVTAGREPSDQRPGPATIALNGELHALVAACLDLLTRTERTILILYYFYGLRFPAIAGVAGIPALVAPPDVSETRSAAQLVQRLKDLAKAGRRQMRRQCPQLADFLTDGADNDG
jgi:DNA-directed RNA polymerase specialized sigma24 family protein